MKDKMAEKKFVEKELSCLMEITLRLEDELNSILNREQFNVKREKDFCYLLI